MPNRILKESICTSENLDTLSTEAEVFFYRLIVTCDDYGLMDARPQLLRSKCFPLKVDRISNADVEKWIKELVDNKLIFLYACEDKTYLKMVNWEHHQNIRAKKSKFPMPESNCIQMYADECKCSRNPIQSESNPNPNPNMCECDTQAEKLSTEDDGAQDDEAEAGSSGKGEYTEDFESFWKAYPKRKEKAKAFRAWKARLKDHACIDEIVKAASNYAEEARLMGTEERFIKNPSTFLGPDKPYVDYINWVPPVQQARQNGAKAQHKMPGNYTNQRRYDSDKLEKALLGLDGGDGYDTTVS